VLKKIGLPFSPILIANLVISVIHFGVTVVELVIWSGILGAVLVDRRVHHVPVIAWTTRSLVAAIFSGPSEWNSSLASTVYGKKLLFNKTDELFGELGDSSNFAFTELIAKAKSMNGGDGPAVRIEITQKVHESGGHAPAMGCQLTW
jgi:hypothetical protein